MTKPVNLLSIACVAFLPSCVGQDGPGTLEFDTSNMKVTVSMTAKPTFRAKLLRSR